MRRILSGFFLFVVLGELVYAGRNANMTSKTWTDPATKLMWTMQDNGKDIDRPQAGTYCSKLRLGGYSDWELPTIDQLAEIYDQTQNVDGWHIKGGIRLSSGWVWSRSTGNASGEAWFLGFDNGVQSSRPVKFSYLDRALCVRRFRTDNR